MKKEIRIFFAFLDFNFFAQACLANYAINPEVKKSITEYDKNQTDNDQDAINKNVTGYNKREKVVVTIIVSLLIVGVIILIVVGVISLIIVYGFSSSF